jgi:hypothetical protein
MTEEADFYCPFCITSWICDGPHISSKKEFKNYIDYVRYNKEDYILTVTNEINKYSLKNNLNLQELSDTIKKRIEGKDR